ncbi:molecular chaperone TorD family protein [Pseudodesulfovibrio sp.]|uniref:TorD/DmsD family molecular chaperone n=1 Tax=Pseudodesulfovibrio sp. TaxID=2035812 RepID=UPI00261EA43E|nr:molecular chaperone TorD family protein [Pseudodesulfovibrio sp.]MDD3312083.1 molecular chaperone TorD family protein [Pseudodesulfovibrio sp.]
MPVSTADTRTRIFLLDCLECAAAVFRGPDADAWTRLAGAGLPDLLDRAPAMLPHATPALRKLQSALSPMNPDLAATLETEFVRLFVAGRGGAAAPPYESCHLPSVTPRTMAAPALDMQRRLDAAGLALGLDSNEPPDHLAIELELLYHLLASSWTQNQPGLEPQARAFATQTLAAWLPRFITALENGDAHPAYTAAAELAEAVAEALA